MKCSLPWVIALLMGLAGPALARDRPPAFTRETVVLVVGEVSSAPKVRLGEQKLQVAIGPEGIDYTLHFFGAQVLGINGRPLDEGDLRDGMWVRAEGRIMKDPRRVKVSRLQVIANDRAGLARSAQLPPGQKEGFITSVAGTRETFPDAASTPVRPTPTWIVGRVVNRPGQGGSSEVTLEAAAAEWHVHLPDEVRCLNSAGETVALGDLRPGQWVRAYGWRTEDLQLRALGLEQIGKASALRASRYFRAGSPLGYAETVPPSALERTRVTGTVRKVDPTRGYLTIRTADQREQRIWLPAAEISLLHRSNQSGYRVGDEVEVTFLTFR